MSTSSPQHRGSSPACTSSPSWRPSRTALLIAGAAFALGPAAVPAVVDGPAQQHRFLPRAGVAAHRRRPRPSIRCRPRCPPANPALPAACRNRGRGVRANGRRSSSRRRPRRHPWHRHRHGRRSLRLRHARIRSRCHRPRRAIRRKPRAGASRAPCWCGWTSGLTASPRRPASCRAADRARSTRPRSMRFGAGGSSLPWSMAIRPWAAWWCRSSSTWSAETSAGSSS